MIEQRPVSRVTSPTVYGLAEAYIDNTMQLGVCNRMLWNIGEWSDKQEEIHKGAVK